MEQTVFVTVGIPASGKTTYYGKLRREYPELKLLSLDLERIRFYLLNNDIEGLKKGNPFQVAYDYYLLRKREFFCYVEDKLERLLREGYSVYYDGTNTYRRVRGKILSLIRFVNPSIKVIALVFPVDLQRSYEWNKRRVSNVPFEYILQCYFYYEEVSSFEGFDEIVTVRV